MHPTEQLVRYYQWLRRYGLNDSHSGNASIRNGQRVWVTPSGACADTLVPDDLIDCAVDAAPPTGASLDGRLHLSVYQRRPDTGAVLHSHGPYTLALTMDGTEFVPIDFEGYYYFPRVPVLTIDYERYVEDSPGQVSDALIDHSIVVVRGHGIYARAESMNLAYKWTCSLEQSARIAFLARQAGTG